jgi:hypothetical protein
MTGLGLNLGFGFDDEEDPPNPRPNRFFDTLKRGIDALVRYRRIKRARRRGRAGVLTRRHEAWSFTPLERDGET